jgi:hypothetical protein
VAPNGKQVVVKEKGAGLVKMITLDGNEEVEVPLTVYQQKEEI